MPPERQNISVSQATKSAYGIISKVSHSTTVSLSELNGMALPNLTAASRLGMTNVRVIMTEEASKWEIGQHEVKRACDSLRAKGCYQPMIVDDVKFAVWDFEDGGKKLIRRKARDGRELELVPVGGWKDWNKQELKLRIVPIDFSGEDY